MDAYGAFLSAPILLPEPTVDDEPRLALIGDDSIVLTRSPRLFAHQLGITRFDRQGTAVVGPIGIATQKDQYQPRDLVTIRDEIFAAWQSLTIARLRAE